MRRGLTHRWVKRVTALVLAIATVACTGGGGAGSSSGSGGGGPVAGSGTIAGTVAGHVLAAVKSAYVIGQPDDPSGTTVVYVFDTAVACDALTSAGWDTRIPDGTGVVEMKLLGKSPGTYAVATGTAQAGQASVNFTLSSQKSTPKELSAQSGSVVLDAKAADGTTPGTFDLGFSDGSARGTFQATACAGGREP